MKTWLKKQIDWFNDPRREVCLTELDKAASVVREATRMASVRGLSDAYELGRSFNRAGPLSLETARCILTGMLNSVGAEVGSGPYNVAEVAGLLGVSKRHAYDLISEGKLGCNRHGQRIVVTREHLDEYESSVNRTPIKTTGFRHL